MPPILRYLATVRRANSIPIGTASCGDVVSIVDEQGRPVPEGEMGELYVDGPTVMLGYWEGGRRTPANAWWLTPATRFAKAYK